MKWNRKRFHNGTVNLTLKNIPDDICKDLKRSAKEHGRSLNAEAIMILAQSVEQERRRRSIPGLLKRIRAFKATLPPMPDSAPLIRAERRRREREIDRY